MSLTHDTKARNSLADALDDDINEGTTDAQGDFVLQDGASDIVAFPGNDPFFGAASSGTITMAGTPKTAAASAGGTVDSFEVRDKDNTARLFGTVTGTGGGGDVEMDNTNVASGQDVELTSFSYTAPN